MNYDESFRYFCLGFAASREGFNGECPYTHIAPEKIFEGYRAAYSTYEILEKDEEVIKELKRLYFYT